MKRFTARARLLKGAVLTFMLALTLLGALLPGAALAAPSGGAAPSAITKPAEWNGGNCSTWYTVQFGDSLSSIAVRFGTTVNALMQANGIWNPNRVLVGQTLCIPGGWNPQPPQPPSGNCVAWHWVKPGQTLSGIAAWYGVSPWAIAQANGIWNWNLIFVGQQLCIPGGGGWQPQPPPPPRPPPCQPEPCGNPCGQPCPLPPPPPPPPPTPVPCPPQPCNPCGQPCPPQPPLYGAWNGEYFNNRDLVPPPTFVRQDPNIAFDWGTWGPGNGVGANNFSVRWAKVENFDGGNYRFWATVDDGVRIWVDDQLIIDYWRIGPATTVQCDHYLSPGPHTIKVEYFQAEGVAVIYVKYARL